MALNNEFEGNLVWIDLEMTGLDPEVDTILEAACIITDGKLNILEEGPNLVIHQSNDILNNMNPWCIEHHGKTGLTDASRGSNISLEDAEQQLFQFIIKHCEPNKGLLAGNSVWQDRNFLIKYMPSITDYLHYRLIDVTSIKALVSRWYPNDEHALYEKDDVHRARNDILESIAELKHYKRYFFI